MKKIFAFTALLFTFILAACSATPYDKAAAQLQGSTASTHYQGVQLSDSKHSDTDDCPAWAGYDIFARCYTYAESYLQSQLGTVDNPLNIPIDKYELGRIQLHGAKVSKSQGLDWFDSNGKPVNTADFEEGVFYTYKKVSSPASFDLVKK
jgi:hypothetical protein